MPYQATIFNVLIASPGDVQDERRTAREVTHEWNSMHSRSRKVVLMPRGWEKDAYSSMGGRAQGELNRQIVDDADLLIAIFGTRIGTPTGEAEGGSIEELTRHMKTGKPAMVFQSFAPADPRQFVGDQYQKLTQFIETWARPKGVLWPYHSLEEFRDELRRQLATRVNDDQYFTPVEPAPSYLKPATEAMHWVTESMGRGPVRVKEDTAGLSPEAKPLLIEACQDSTGCIIFTMMSLTTNNKNFINNGDPRSPATWEGALQELREGNFLTDRGNRGEVFQLTKKGFDAADRLRTQ